MLFKSIKQRRTTELWCRLPYKVLLSPEEHEAGRGARGQSGEGPNLLRRLPPQLQLSAGGRRRQVGQSWTLESGEFSSAHDLRSSHEKKLVKCLVFFVCFFSFRLAGRRLGRRRRPPLRAPLSTRRLHGLLNHSPLTPAQPQLRRVTALHGRAEGRLP